MWDYQAIYEHTLSAGSDCIDYFGGTFTGGYFIQQSPEEVASFLESLQHVTVRNYLEIGTAACGTTRLVTDCVKVENVHLLDLCDHRRSCYKDSNLPQLQHSGALRTFWGDSHSPEAATWVSESSYDLVMIDGDHSYEGASQDFEVVWPHVVEGGLIAFHDYVAVPEVADVVNGLLLGDRVLPRSLHAQGAKPMGIFVFRKVRPWKPLV